MSAIMGLDLSLTATGVARANGTTFTIKTNAKRKDRRLEDIYTTLLSSSHDVEFAVIEDLPFSSRMAGVVGMVQGVARLALQRNGVKYAFISAATLKKFATGNGRADKVDMALALIEHYQLEPGEIDIIDKGKQYVPALGIELTDDNQVDAAWLRIAGLVRLGYTSFDTDRAALLDTGKWDNWNGSYSL